MALLKGKLETFHSLLIRLLLKLTSYIRIYYVSLEVCNSKVTLYYIVRMKDFENH